MSVTAQRDTVPLDNRNFTYFRASEANEFVTRSQVDQAQQEQDKGIRLEFRNVSTRLEKLESTVSKGISHIDGRFERVDAEFDGVAAGFESVYARFDRVDERFEGIEKRFDGVDKRFERIDDRFERVDDRFERLEQNFRRLSQQVHNLTAANTNRLAYRPRDPICATYIDDRLPEFFPANVVQFWSLRTKKNHPRIKNLCRLYHCDYSSDYPSYAFPNDDEGREHVEEDMEEYENDRALDDEELEQLLSTQPDDVLQCLADKLGLDLTAIRSHCTPQLVGKRKLPLDALNPIDETLSDSNKRQKAIERHHQDADKLEGEKPPTMSSSSMTSSFKRALMRDPEASSTPSAAKSPIPQITWDRDRTRYEKMRHDETQPSPTSTVPLSQLDDAVAMPRRQRTKSPESVST